MLTKLHGKILLLLCMVSIYGCSQLHYQYYDFGRELVEIDGVRLVIEIKPENPVKEKAARSEGKPYELMYFVRSPKEQHGCVVSIDFQYKQKGVNSDKFMDIETQHLTLRARSNHGPGGHNTIQFYPEPLPLTLFTKLKYGQECINEGKLLEARLELGRYYVDRKPPSFWFTIFSGV